MKRGLVVAVLLCLVGSALVLLATSTSWLTLQSEPAPPLPAQTTHVEGSVLAPGVRGLALLGLAAVAALAATRTWGRVAVGGLAALTGLGIAVLVLRVLNDPGGAVDAADVRVVGDLPGLSGWPYVALLGSGLITAAGGLTAVRGGSWTALGPAYDAPDSAKPRDEASAWEALDRGEDPTS